MSIYLIVPLLVVVALIQATVMPHLLVWGVFPNLPLLVVVSWSLLRGAREGVVWGFVAGVAVDIFSSAPFGAATLSLMAVGFLSGLGQATVFRAHFVWPLIVMFLTTIVSGVIFLVVVQIAGQSVTWLESFLRIIVPSALLNALLTPLVFVPMRFLYTRFRHDDMDW